MLHFMDACSLPPDHRMMTDLQVYWAHRTMLNRSARPQDSVISISAGVLSPDSLSGVEASSPQHVDIKARKTEIDGLESHLNILTVN